MRRTAFDESRDQRVAADETASYGLMCAAHGCPSRWSVDPPRMCGAHAWADSHHWPQITQEQLDAETQRAMDAANPPAPQRFVKPDPVKLSRYLRKLADGIADAQRSPREWADRLRQREEAGDRLTPAQKDAWRSVHGAMLAGVRARVTGAN